MKTILSVWGLVGLTFLAACDSGTPEAPPSNPSSSKSPSTEPPPTPKGPYSWLLFNHKNFVHHLSITVNGKPFFKYERGFGGFQSKPIPFVDGQNTMTLTMNVVPGKDPDHMGGSHVELFLGQKMMPDEALDLYRFEAWTATAEARLEIEMKSGILGRVKIAEDLWFDAKREKPARKSEETYDDTFSEQLLATVKTWLEDGTLESESRKEKGLLVSSRDYKPDGSLGAEVKSGEGWHREFWDDGDLYSDVKVQGGNYEGLYTTYHGEGKVSSTTTYVDGYAEGPYLEYDEEGRVRVRGTYKDNAKEGVWKRLDSRGKETIRSVFKEGEKIEGIDLFE